jgi:hypothetical protein
LYGVDCEIDVGTVYRKDLFRVISGEEYIKDGRLDFGDHHLTGEYKTIGHVSFVQSTIFYRTSNVNLSKAVFSRTFTVRKPELPGYDGLLRENQIRFIEKHKHVMLDYASDFVHNEGLRWDVEDTFKHTTLPHQKRGLRVAGAICAIVTGVFLSVMWSNHLTEGILKRWEPAKNGKVCRAIYNLGVLRCIQGCWAAEAMKMHIAGKRLEIDGSYAQFVKSPTFSILEEVYTSMAKPSTLEYEVRYYVHSDDTIMFISYLDDDDVRHTHVYNVDISKCDASYTDDMFLLINDMYKHGFNDDIVKKLVDQLYGKIKYRCLDDRRKKVVIELLYRLLLSGSVLTTCANTLLNMCIFVSIMASKPKSCEDIVAAVAEVGVIVTGVTTEADFYLNYQGQQFLKTSPVELPCGRRIPVPNLGPMFRNFGITINDFIGKAKMPVYLKAEAHIGSVINGMYPRIHCPFLTKLRKRFSFRLTPTLQMRVDLQNFDQHKIQHDVKEEIHMTDEMFFGRYLFMCVHMYNRSLGLDDIDELCHLIVTSPPNARILTLLSNTVLNADYELGLPV